jgi:hypothetical protein
MPCQVAETPSCGTRSDFVAHISFGDLVTRKVIDFLIMTLKALPDEKADI